jgi:diguanylate cyclase (GGDEF)-like protein
MLDIDLFKHVNDSFGHKAGDNVLAAVAEAIRINSRAEDLVYRYGGEEFCSICPGAGLDVAIKVSERIRESVENLSIAHDGKQIKATISIGISTMNPGHASHEDMLKDADSALYRAKEHGRNRVEH